MKLQVKDTDYVADIGALKSISEAALSDGVLKYVGSEGVAYTYFSAAKKGNYAPNDQSGGSGWWVKDVGARLYEWTLNIDPGHTEVTSNHPFETSKPVIMAIADITDKHHTSINYKTELKDGVRLYIEETFLLTGLVDVCTLYYGYVDENDKGQEVIRVEHNWTVDTAGTPIKVAQKVIEREKVRKYMTHDGTYHADQKTTTKPYLTAKSTGEEGERRRNNVLRMLQVGVVTMILVNGLVASQEAAEEMLLDMFQTFNSETNAYLKAGKGSLYDDITNDTTFTWADTLIGGTAQAILGLPTGWDVKNIREYMVKKLKGEV